MSSHNDSSSSEDFFFLSSIISSADVNPDHHMKILEALIVVGGLTEMQAAPGRQTFHFSLRYCMNLKHEEVLAHCYQFPALALFFFFKADVHRSIFSELRSLI